MKVGQDEEVSGAGDPGTLVDKPAWCLARHLPAVAGFVVLTVAYFWPIVHGLHTRLLSGGGDGSTFIWAYWHMPRRLERLADPFVTSQLFHPVGADLAFHTSTPLAMVLSWPLSRLFGLVVTVNLLELTAVFLSALAAYLLALHVCNDRRAAFVAGVAFALVPYRFAHAGAHLNLIHAEFIPFGLLALLRLIDQPSRWRAAVLGAVVGMTFLTDFNLTIFLLLAIAVIAVSQRHQVFRREVGRQLVVVAGVAALVALPLLVPVARALANDELDSVAGWGGASVFSADLLSWIVPPARHPIWGPKVAELLVDHNVVAHPWRTLSGFGEGIAYPGLLVLFAAVAGRRFANRSRRQGWVALAWVSALLAMGPYLRIAGLSGDAFSYLGRQFTVPLPSFVLHKVPILDGLRAPGRFVILAVLALDLLLALALADVMRRHPKRAWAAFTVALAVTLIEFLPGSLKTYPSKVPLPYHQVAAATDPGAVLEVPLQWRSGIQVIGGRDQARDHSAFMYYATTHGKPLVSGYIARYPERRFTRLKAIPVYRQVLALGGEPGFEDRPVFDAGDLRAMGIGYVVYHRDRPQPRAFEYLKALGLEVLADDGVVIAWKVGR